MKWTTFALRKVGQKDSFAEVDLYLQAEDFLFLVDCKAYSLTREYFRGDRRDVENRWELIRQWISKSDKRAVEIAKTPVGANYRIPRTVKYLVPVVCSACPEFFGSTDDSLFIVPRKIPRVCTYEELVQTVRNPQGLQLANRPFTISLDSE